MHGTLCTVHQHLVAAFAHSRSLPQPRVHLLPDQLGGREGAGPPWRECLSAGLADSGGRGEFEEAIEHLEVTLREEFVAVQVRPAPWGLLS